MDMQQELAPTAVRDQYLKCHMWEAMSAHSLNLNVHSKSCKCHTYRRNVVCFRVIKQFIGRAALSDSS